MDLFNSKAVLFVRAIAPTESLVAAALGREPDDRPRGGAYWKLADGSGLLVVVDEERAGTGHADLPVPDLGEALARVDAAGGLGHGQIVAGVLGSFVELTDADGNELTITASRLPEGDGRRPVTPTRPDISGAPSIPAADDGDAGGTLRRGHGSTRAQ